MEKLNKLKMEMVCGGSVAMPGSQWVIATDARTIYVPWLEAPVNGIDVPGPVYDV